jgi:hypothetical protein
VRGRKISAAGTPCPEEENEAGEGGVSCWCGGHGIQTLRETWAGPRALGEAHRAIERRPQTRGLPRGEAARDRGSGLGSGQWRRSRIPASRCVFSGSVPDAGRGPWPRGLSVLGSGLHAHPDDLGHNSVANY